VFNLARRQKRKRRAHMHKQVPGVGLRDFGLVGADVNARTSLMLVKSLFGCPRDSNEYSTLFICPCRDAFSLPVLVHCTTVYCLAKVRAESQLGSKLFVHLVTK
jgi:hypothetical protein